MMLVFTRNKFFTVLATTFKFSLLSPKAYCRCPPLHFFSHISGYPKSWHSVSFRGVIPIGLSGSLMGGGMEGILQILALRKAVRRWVQMTNGSEASVMESALPNQ